MKFIVGWFRHGSLPSAHAISDRSVVAITINHEDLRDDEIIGVCARFEKQVGCPVCDVIKEGPARVVQTLVDRLPQLATAEQGVPAPDELTLAKP